MRWAGPTVVMLTLGSVGCPLTIEPSHAPSIGDTCEIDQDCGIGFCGTETSGGYCSMDCSHEACPEGSRCVLHQVPLLPPFSVCMRNCQTTADCRRAGVVCQSPPFAGGDPVCS